jgi:hypothetical protein
MNCRECNTAQFEAKPGKSVKVKPRGFAFSVCPGFEFVRQALTENLGG